MDKVQIHWLHQQTFCEYQLYMELVRGKIAPDSKETTEGDAIHRDLEEKLQTLTGLPPMSSGEAIEYCANECVDVRMPEVKVVGDRLYGKIDEVWLTTRAVYVIENKPRSPNGDPFLSDKRQALGYCMAFKEQHPEYGLPVVAVIRDRDTEKRLWFKVFDDADKFDLDDCISRILDIANGVREPVPTQKPQKCKVCRWLPSCDKASS